MSQLLSKLHILDEIRRTAKSNGGNPLGRERFSSETGIKIYDWQKYWPRWSDAVTEAGYAPNQLNLAYSKDELLERYAKLTLELGRLPTNSDLRVRFHQEELFPSVTTFDKLGNKAAIVKLLFEYCQTREAYQDVLQHCEKYKPKEKKLLDDGGSPIQVGFVYLIRSGKFHKLGRSNAAGRREREIALQLPDETKTVHVIKTDDPVGIEAYWHNRFAAKRKNGEWFDLSADDIHAFKRRKFM